MTLNFIAYVNVTLYLPSKIFSLKSNHCPNRTFPPHWAIQCVALFLKQRNSLFYFKNNV